MLESQEHQDRIQVMLDHLKNVQQELGFTQSRVESKNRELETEKHIKTLTERAAVRHWTAPRAASRRLRPRVV